MNSPRPIVVDIDGVLAEWNRAMWATLKTAGEPMIPFDGPEFQPKVWSWLEAHGASPRAIQRELSRPLTERTAFWLGLGRVDGFTRPSYDREVNSAGDTILNDTRTVFLTARPHDTRGLTGVWLYRHAGVEDPTVFCTPTRKLSALIGLEPQVVIEDSADTLRQYRNAIRDLGLPPCELILVYKPYNRQGDLSGLTICTTTDAAFQVAAGVTRHA